MGRIVVRTRRPDRQAGRLATAALGSIIFHIAVVGVLLCLLGPSEATSEHDIQAVIEAGADLTAEPPLLINGEVDPFNRGLDEVHHEVEREAKVEAFGLVDLWAQPGVIGNKPAAEVQLPPPPGVHFGTAGPNDGVAAAPAGQPDGEPWRDLPGGSIQGRASAATRDALAKKGGGNDRSQAAVSRGLQWLVRQQEANGSWRLDGPFTDKGKPNDTAGTALGLLPLLGSGYTHRSKLPDGGVNPFDKPIERALVWLINRQNRRTGDLGGGMYGHCLAAIALCEAYGLSQDPHLRRPAQIALNFLVRGQHEFGGWRYTPGQAGDTSVSGWAIMALKSGQMAGLDVPEANLRKAISFLDFANDPQSEGYGYVSPNPQPTTTAVGLLCRQYLQGWGRQNIRMIRGIDTFLKANPPERNLNNIYYIYYATQVMHHFGGMGWDDWNRATRDGLIAGQTNDGSWSAANDRHGAAGGRLMVTALALLTLEVYYRHLPLYYREMK